MQYEKGDWYDQWIEDPLKGLVRYLRNNGINTTCSCGHKMWIECYSHLGYGIPELHHLVWTYLHEHPGEVGYDGVFFSIHLEHRVMDGHAHTTMTLCLGKPEHFKKLDLEKKQSMRGWKWPGQKETGGDGYRELRQMHWTER